MPFVYKKNGKVAVTSTNVVSADRNTTTITSKGTYTLGQTINSVAVFDKQYAAAVPWSWPDGVVMPRLASRMAGHG